jgi:hypothetical protein
MMELAVSWPSSEMVRLVQTITVTTPVYIFGFHFNTVIILILDLDRPNAGLIQTSQQLMLNTAAALAAFTD